MVGSLAKVCGMTPKLRMRRSVHASTLAPTPSPTLALTPGTLDPADFFPTEFEGTASKASNTEAQPSFTLRDLCVPWNTEGLLDRRMRVPDILSQGNLSVRDSLN